MTNAMPRQLARYGQYPALVLNSDYLPLSTFPLSVWPWMDAVHAVFSDRVSVVSNYDAFARSPSTQIQLPSVVTLRDYVKTRRMPAFTRHNVLLRDRMACAYCAQVFPAHGLTFDHVIPRAKGGRTCWTNIVSACHACNGTKRDRTPEEAKMPLQWRPWQPTNDDLFRRAKPSILIGIPSEWHDFLEV